MALCSAISQCHHSPQWERGGGTRVALGLFHSWEFPCGGETESSERLWEDERKKSGKSPCRYELPPMLLKTLKTEIKMNLLVLPLFRLLLTCSPRHHRAHRLSLKQRLCKHPACSNVLLEQIFSHSKSHLCKVCPTVLSMHLALFSGCWFPSRWAQA